MAACFLGLFFFFSDVVSTSAGPEALLLLLSALPAFFGASVSLSRDQLAAGCSSSPSS